MPRSVLCLFALLLGLVGCAREGEVDFPQQFAPGVVREGPDWAARRQRFSYAMPEIERYLLAEAHRHDMPSMVAAIVVDGRAIFWRGFGVRDLQLGGPVTTHTMYRIGSITKVITAMAVLKLRDDGLLHLDAPAEVYVPELREVRYPRVGGPRITVRHLLTHQSGLPRVGKLEYDKPRSAPVSERELLGVLRNTDMAWPAGTKARYSNLGYAVLGVIVGRAAGMRYRDYVTTNILEPIGMTLARWDREALPHDQLATGYGFERGGYQPKHHWRMGAAEGMGGLYASLDDMVRFVSYHMSAWPPHSRPDYDPLSCATLRESHSGFQGPSGVRSAGWVLSSGAGVGALVGHNGATENYAAVVTFSPHHRIGFVAMANTGRVSDALTALGPRVLKMLLASERRGGRSPRFRRPPGH